MGLGVKVLNDRAQPTWFLASGYNPPSVLMGKQILFFIGLCLHTCWCLFAPWSQSATKTHLERNEMCFIQGSLHGRAANESACIFRKISILVPVIWILNCSRSSRQSRILVMGHAAFTNMYIWLSFKYRGVPSYHPAMLLCPFLCPPTL